MPCWEWRAMSPTSSCAGPTRHWSSATTRITTAAPPNRRLTSRRFTKRTTRSLSTEGPDRRVARRPEPARGRPAPAPWRPAPAPWRRARPPWRRARPHGGCPGSSAAGQAGPGAGEAGIEERLASLERELAVIRAAERLRAQEPTRPAPRRPTPEELGYYTTEDSLTKIIDDAADSLAQRLDRSDTKRQFTRRLSDLLGRDD